MPSSFAATIRARQGFTRETLARLEERSSALAASLVEATLALEAAQAVVDALRNERECVDGQRAALECTLSDLPPPFDPQIMQRLPTEMLRAIFHEVVFRPDPEWTSYISADLERAAAPFVCAAVCRRWRTVATSMVSLWSYVAVPILRSDEPGKSAFYFRRVQLLVQRSKSSLLDVVLDWHDGCKWSAEPNYAGIVATLASQISRWRRFDFAMPCGVTPKQVEFLRVPAPLLEHVSIYSTDDGMLPFPGPSVVYLPDSPLLRDISSGTIFLTPQKPMLRLTCADLVIQAQPAHILWAALQMMPELEDLRLDFIEVPQTFPDVPCTALTLPALRRLTVSRRPHVMSSWMSALRLPALEELVTCGPDCMNSRAFRDFCLTVCPGISALTLEDAILNCDEADNALPLPTIFPRIRRLTLSGYFPASLLDYLGGRALWPLLQRVEFSACWLRGEEAESVVAFARNRSSPREATAPALEITVRDSSVAAWLPGQLALILGDNAVHVAAPWNEQQEVRELEYAASDEKEEEEEEEL
ncbi:hypothetical protein AURDEDRAFT_170519 [Auricularia subglabra TFB-10046 SS5]|nr:hypothetical protein AURDEDRAFT_170519 [Auricularia subglabra TFB-10046 SS5]